MTSYKPDKFKNIYPKNLNKYNIIYFETVVGLALCFVLY